MTLADTSDFQALGAQHLPGLIPADEIERLAALFCDAGKPGRRLGINDLRPVADLFVADGPVGRAAACFLGKQGMPVRALLLDKSSEANWALGWHQDRTIAVKVRKQVDGFTNWSVKHGQQHVEPPFELTSRMVTVRIHLDPVTYDNGPLKILTGSHRLGRLTDARICELAAFGRQLVCLAEAGDGWVYATAVVHASDRQLVPGRRRVLQIDYAGEALPSGLEWALASLAA